MAHTLPQTLTTDQHVLIGIHGNGVYHTLHPIERNVFLHNQNIPKLKNSETYRETTSSHWGQIRDLDRLLSRPWRYWPSGRNDDFFICLTSAVYLSYQEDHSHH